MRWLPALLIVPVLAGCLGADPVQEAPVSTGQVVSDGPVAGAAVTVQDVRTTTDADGRFQVKGPEGACTVRIVVAGYVPKETTRVCPFTDLRIELQPMAAEAPPATPEVPDTPETPETPEAPVARATLYGRAVDADTGTGIASAAWRLSRGATELAQGFTAQDGRFEATLPVGPVHLDLSAPCRAPVTHDTDLRADLDLEVTLEASAGAAVGTPGLQATGGVGEVTLTWSRVDDAMRYEVEDDETVLDLGGARAWVDHSPGDAYRVRAIGPCSTAGAWSEPASASPLPGSVPSLATPRPVARTSAEREYPVLDINGTSVGKQKWRVVTGTGNCCENYIATTRQGWVLDFGGESLLLSKDEGQTWQEVVPHTIQICGEGAVVPGPGGDIYAMNWEFCLGAGDDGVWTLKYVAEDDSWIEGAGPVHSPFFDRPWMSVLPGPHLDAAGQPAAVRSYIFTNFNDGLYGQGHVVSGDGVAYLPQPPLIDSTSVPDQALPERLALDPDADWTQPIVQSYGKSLDAGLGIVDTGLTLCQVLDTETGRACAGHDLPVRSMQRDGGGRLHAVTFRSDAFDYMWSDDVGRSWQKTTVPLPPGVQGILEWDLKAHHGLDRAVVALHAQVAEGALDYAVVLKDIRGTPTVDRVLQVGAGGGTAGSGVTETEQRYDFMTTGFLPDGRVVLSFTDGEFHPPAVAIELK